MTKRSTYIASPSYRQEHTLAYKLIMVTAAFSLAFLTAVAILAGWQL